MSTKCRAWRDGLINGHYIFEGQEFYAEVCPSWAVAIEGEQSPSLPAPKKRRTRKPVEVPVDEEKEAGDGLE